LDLSSCLICDGFAQLDVYHRSQTLVFLNYPDVWSIDNAEVWVIVWIYICGSLFFCSLALRGHLKDVAISIFAGVENKTSWSATAKVDVAKTRTMRKPCSHKLDRGQTADDITHAWVD
jgi:hypothetical protein